MEDGLEWGKTVSRKTNEEAIAIFQVRSDGGQNLGGGCVKKENGMDVGDFVKVGLTRFNNCLNVEAKGE